MSLRDPQDSTGKAIRVGDRVGWRGKIYTIKSFGEAIGRFGTRAIEFEEPLHAEDEVPDEIAVDLVQEGSEPTSGYLRARPARTRPPRRMR